MIDLSQTIAAKSDQLNADDLIGRELLIEITKVSRNNSDQPIAVSYSGDNGKPWLPCKTMRRVLVWIWGKDGTKYVGRKLVLFRDPNVTFGGLASGGIRISHMSHISHDTTLVVTVTKKSKKAYTVQPLIEDEPVIDFDKITGEILKRVTCATSVAEFDMLKEKERNNFTALPKASKQTLKADLDALRVHLEQDELDAKKLIAAQEDPNTDDELDF
jgi:hypothetical protein